MKYTLKAAIICLAISGFAFIIIYHNCDNLQNKQVSNRRGILDAEQRVCSGEERADEVRKLCHQLYPKYTDNLNLTEVHNGMVVEQRHKLLYGMLLKSGTTSMLTVLAAAQSNMFPDEVAQKWPSIHTNLAYFGIPTLGQTEIPFEEWKQYYKFTMVRHPFARLYSAYREKFLKGDGWPKWAQPKIEKHLTNVVYDAKGIARLTFAQFIELVSLHQLVEVHWKPAFSYLNLCKVNYDYIGRIETIKADINFWLPKLKMSTYIHRNMANYTLSNTGKVVENPQSDPGSHLEKELGKIPSKQIQRLKEIYSEDFHILGYDWNSTSPHLMCKTANLECC